LSSLIGRTSNCLQKKKKQGETILRIKIPNM
jgi:hypothetical protein